MIASGKTLNQLNSMECDNTMLKCRKWLTSNSIQLEEITKFLLLNVKFLINKTLSLKSQIFFKKLN